LDINDNSFHTDDMKDKSVSELVEFAEMIRTEMEQRLSQNPLPTRRIKLLRHLSEADRIVTEMKGLLNDND